MLGKGLESEQWKGMVDDDWGLLEEAPEAVAVIALDGTTGRAHPLDINEVPSTWLEA
ncbi:hypothetical protein IMZ48_36615 [Candidatus Bathyarchaeota archaeon]|nr:hypothetical protein [Candidatus Bathyarchaeota archaeon]